MRISAISLLLLVVSCAKPYRPAGDPGPLQLSGTYEMSETMYSNDCPPSVGRASGIEARKNKIKVEVLNAAPSALLKLTVDVESFDGQVLQNGTFEVKPISSSRGSVSIKRSIQGRFTATGFTARYMVETLQAMPQTRSGPVETQICKYNLRWEAVKL
jgi:hypothetical protein